MTPFGWRFSGALFGVLLVPLLYILLKLMLGSTPAASCAALIYAADFMRFAQSRISTIDTYGVFFTLLMYLFFYFYYTQPWDAPLHRTLLPLGLSGLSFALGVASKWTCVFGLRPDLRLRPEKAGEAASSEAGRGGILGSGGRRRSEGPR